MTTENIPDDGQGGQSQPGAPQPSGDGFPESTDPERRRFFKLCAIASAVLAGPAALATWTGCTVKDLVESFRETSNTNEPNLGDPVLLEGSEVKTVRLQREITAVLSAILMARESIQILGINALGPLHQAMEKLEEMLSRGKFVSVGVMNPLGDKFNLRETQECKTQGTGSVSSRLSCEWVATFGILRQLYLRRGVGTLDAWIHPFYPHGSLVIVDGELVQYNPYETPEACQAALDANLPRGITCQLEIYSRRTAPGSVERFCSEFRKLRGSGQALDLDSFELVSAVLSRWGSRAG